jgi:hypothetical protein
MPDTLLRRAMKDPPNSGRVRVLCSDPDLRIEGWLGSDSPEITGGFGGWETTPRPRQVSMVTYGSVEPFELTFKMIWDRTKAQTTNEGPNTFSRTCSQEGAGCGAWRF